MSGTTAATAFWTLAVTTYWQGTFPPGALPLLTGVTATALVAAIGWLVPAGAPPAQPIS
jgi:hypothetical protein